MVLIDTWWNVNAIVTCKSFLSETVLIDTWWNVNARYYTFDINKPLF